MNSDNIKTVGDVAATAIGWAAVFKWLPAVAAGLTIIWTAIRIYEWVEGRVEKRRARKLALLQN
jgi:hypothetical protein